MTTLPPPSLVQPVELPEPLVELRRLLTRSQGFTLAFVVCNVLTEERRLMDLLTSALPADCQVRRVEAPATAHELIDDLFSVIEKDQAGDVIFVTGLERLVPTADPHPVILELLNQLRERFRRLKTSVVFWVSDFVLTRIAREAPDFWAWRSGVFEIEFDHQTVRLVTRDVLNSHSDSNQFANLPKQEREELYEVLQALWVERLLTQADTADAQSAALVLRLASLAYFLDRPAESRYWLELAVKSQEREPDQRILSASLHQLAILEEQQGNFAEAQRLLQRSIQIDESLGDQRGLSISFHQLAILELQQGNLAAARRLLQRSSRIFESLGDQRGLSASLRVLAILEVQQGNLGEVHRLLERAMQIQESLGDQRGLSGSLHQLANLEVTAGNTAEARCLWERSIAIAEGIGDVVSAAGSKGQLAQLELAEGHGERALELAREAVRQLESLGDAQAKQVRGVLRSIEQFLVNGGRRAEEAPELQQQIAE